MKANDLTAGTTGIKPKVVVVGAGISGLTAAFTLIEESRQPMHSIDVVLLESSARAGGVVKTIVESGAIIESGPEAFITSKSAVLDLCRQLEITDRLISTNEQYRTTFVGLNQKLHPLPEGFVMLAPTRIMPFLKSELFTVSGKLRMAMDLLIPARRSRDDESLSEFVLRRFGKEILERVAQPMIAGIHSAAPELLSARAALPQFVDFEQSHGSVIAGLLSQVGGLPAGNREQTPSGARYSMFATFDQGMSVLTEKLASRLPPGCLRTNSPVEAVRPGTHGRLWDVVSKTGEVFSADAVIVAIPVAEATRVLRLLDSGLTKALGDIPPASSIVITQLYRRNDISHELNGFGFVVPRTEKRAIVACTFSNVKFPNRAPKGMVLLRSFVNGAVNPQLLGLSPQCLMQLVARDLEAYLGVKSAPIHSVMTRHDQVTAQYRVGHRQRMEQISLVLESFPGLHLAGNAYSGAGIPDCIAGGKKAALEVVSGLQSKMMQVG